MANVKNNNGQPQLTSTEIARFLDIQEAEIKARTQELAIRSKEIDASSRSAEKSIDAQLEVEKLRQQAFLSLTKQRAWLIGLAILAGLTIVVLALWKDKDAVAIELLKQGAMLLGSFAGGYAIGTRKQRAESGDDP